MQSDNYQRHQNAVLHVSVLVYTNPADTKIWDQCWLMLDQRRARWSNIKATLDQSLVFSWNSMGMHSPSG